jgi:hypothetical protein
MKKMRFEHLELVLLLIILFVAIIPASADNTTTISFSDLNLVTHSDVEIYGADANGTWSLLSVQNTTSTGLVFQPGVYSIVIRPSEQARFSSLSTFVTDFASWFETNALFLFAFGAFLAVILVATRRRR